MDADRDRNRGPAGRQLFEDLEVNLVGLTSPTPFLGLGQAQQTCSAKLSDNRVGISLGPLVFVDDREKQPVGDVTG
jgi:hypothetical protein